MEQTAVEWFAKELDKRHCVILNYPEYQKLLEQAKAMEKQRLEQFFNQGYTQCSIESLEIKSRERYKDAEDYYNKTFKKE